MSDSPRFSSVRHLPDAYPSPLPPPPRALLLITRRLGARKVEKQAIYRRPNVKKPPFFVKRRPLSVEKTAISDPKLMRFRVGLRRSQPRAALILATEI